jgi:hypothetical protein
LHYAKIRTAIQEMRCERVTQRMRMKGGWEAGANGGLIQSSTRTTLTERRAVAIQKERITCRGRRLEQLRSAACKVALQCADARRTEECNALLLSFSGDTYLTARQVEVALFNRHNLCNAEPSAIEEFDECGVTQRERWRISRSGGLNEARHLFSTQHIGEATFTLWPCKRLKRILCHTPLPHPEAIERSERSKPLLHRGALCPIAKCCHIAAQVRSFWGAPINALSVTP